MAPSATPPGDGDGHPPPAAPTCTVYYDADCGWCRGWAYRLRSRDRDARITWTPLSEGRDRREIGTHIPDDTMVTVVHTPAAATGHGSSGPGGDYRTLHIQADAVFAAARFLPWPWRAMVVGRYLPSALCNAVYQRFARIRHRLPGGRL